MIVAIAANTTSKLPIHNIFAAMSTIKRKALESKLNRRVRARRDESEEVVEASEDEAAPPSEEGASGSEDENASGDENQSGDESVRACSSARKVITNAIGRAIRRGPNRNPKTTPSLTKLELSPSAH